MKKFKSSLVLLFVLIVFTLSSIPLNVKGVLPDSIDYTFANNNLYDTTKPIFNESTNVNVRDVSEYTQFYNATFDFNNEIVGTNGTNIDFIDLATIGVDTTIQIISLLNGHRKVLELNDNDVGAEVIGQNTFDSTRLFGTIELFIRNTDTSLRTDILIRSGITNALQVAIAGNTANQLQYFDGIWNNIVSIIDNIWYHIRIDFECGADGYESLAPDTFHIYVNGIKYSDLSFRNTVSTVNNLRLQTNVGNSGYFTYFDAIGYSWFKPNYNFTNDVIGSFPEFWINNDDFPNMTTVIASLDGNTKVMEMNDFTRDGTTSSSLSFNRNQDGFIQFLIAKDNLSNDAHGRFRFQEGNNERMRFSFIGADLYYLHANTSTELFVSNALSLINTFTDFKFVLDDTNNEVDLYIDDILKQSNVNYFTNTVDTINKITIQTVEASVPDSIYRMFFDDFDFNHLTINTSINNIIPHIETNPFLKEVDTFTFDLVSANTLYDIGTDNPSGWSDVENGFDHTNIAQDNTDIPSGSRTNNRVVQIEGVGSDNAISGIEKDFNISSGIFNITMKYNYSLNNNDLGSFIISIFTQNLQLQVKINCTFVNAIFGNQLDYRNSSFKNVELIPFLDSTIAINQEVSYNIYIDSFVVFRATTEGSLGFHSYNFTFPLINPDSFGLGKIMIISDPTNVGGTFQTIELKEVGVYHNGISLSDDFGYLPSVISDNASFFWQFLAHNLITIEVLGNMAIHATSFNEWILGGNMEVISNMDTFNLTQRIINVYFQDFVHFGFLGIPTPMIVFFITSQFNLTSISINGIKFSDDTPHDFGFLAYESGGVDNNVSYFFLDSSNTLKYFHTTDDNNVNEFIQAELVIGGLDTNNTAIQFNSNKDNNAFGFFRVSYVSTSTIFKIQSIFKTTISILPNSKSIISYIILITDNNDNTVSGLTTGFVSNIKLLFTEQQIVSVITFSLLSVLIPLIIILIPSLALRMTIGKFAFIPSFILMTIISIISGLIPTWLFFVIMLSSSLFIFNEKDNRVDI